MSRRNGGIIGPTNTPVGGLFKGVAGGVWRMNDVLTFVSNNQWPSGPQSIDNSCRFNDGDSPRLQRNLSDGNDTATTISMWFKRSTITTAQTLLECYADSSNYFRVRLEADDVLQIRDRLSGSDQLRLKTSALFRDTSAWYNLVISIDTTNGTAADRCKVFINGTRITSFGTETTYGSSDVIQTGNASSTVNVGGSGSGDNYLDGYMAEVVFVDGQTSDETSFGETDSTTGIWKPKKIGSFTSAGDNSFYLDFKDSSTLGNDASGLNNDFTVNNLTSIDQSTDTCVVNYATLVNASSASATYTLSEGNLKVEKSASNWYGSPRANMGVRNGKWYYECKVVNKANGFMIGYMSASNLTDVGDRATNNFPKLNGFQASGYIKRQDNTEVNISSSFTWANGDIAQIALDMDNKKLWVGKNGSYYNSGDPASGSNETIGSSYFDSNEDYLPVITMYGTNEGQFNFGNPPYSISSGNSDANGFGNFEYAVPSGYYAINTTNLNTYG
jgi:hypothetical protein